MTGGLILLLVATVAIYLGLGQRLLDRMRLTDKQALFFLLAMVVGSFITVNLAPGGAISLNIGGGVVPLVLAVYLLATADTPAERWRGFLAAAVTAGLLYGLVKLFTFEFGQTFLDSVYIFGMVAGLSAYLIGRSRRAAFAGGVLGVLILDLLHLVEIRAKGLPGRVAIGGAGIFDSLVLAAFLAVLLAELVGEARERLGGGPVKERVPATQKREEKAEGGDHEH